MKKFLLIFSAMMALMVSPVFAARFSDLKEDHWAYSVVNQMMDKGILNGYPDGTFKPNNSITRAEFAKILVLSMNLDKPSETKEISDMYESHWAYEYIQAASNYLNGITYGSYLLYMPDSAAVREDMTVALVKAAGLQNASYSLSTLNRFSDSERISPDIQKYIAIAVENDLVHGNSDGTFNPKGYLTRAEVSQMIINTLRATGNESNVANTFGDVNGDFRINEEDVTLLKGYLSNQDVYMNKRNADVDEDGKITIRDRLILERHVAQIEGYDTLPYKGSFVNDSQVGLNSNQKMVSVATADEFIQAIDNDTRIVLTGDLYNITELLTYNDNDHIIDGQINGINNMVIESKLGAEIIVDDPYKDVLFFKNCKDITLNNLVIGHSVMGGCMAGVVGLSNCGQVNLINCDLYGCGAYGVSVFEYMDSTDIAIPLLVDNCYIHDCSSDSFTFYAPVDAIIQNSFLYNTENLFNIYECNIEMVNCKIENFSAQWWSQPTWLMYLGRDANLNMKNCTIKNSSMDILANMFGNPTVHLSDCTFINCEYPKYTPEGFEGSLTMKNVKWDN